MGRAASQITNLVIVHLTVYTGTDQRKHQSSASLAFVQGNSPVTSEFPTQMASNAENVSFVDVIMGVWKMVTVLSKTLLYTLIGF